MQIFVVYKTSYYESLKCLDKSRLGNQVYREAKTILNGGWSNHPVSKMWEGYEYSLCDYCLDGLRVLRERCTPYPKWEIYFTEKQKHYKNTGRPPFIGNEKFHASHRSHLLFKGRCDSAWLALKSWYIMHSVPRYKWISKSDIGRKNIEFIEKELAKRNAKIPPNHYAQFGWKEPDNLPYVWILPRRAV